ncbi:MAG: folate-binding protein YgfZ, partial [Bacteroidia bacterium]
VQLDDAGQRFECYVDTSAASEQMSALQKNTQLATESHWQALDIEAGIARIDTDMVEQYIPQTLNFDLTGHISFTKGCYTGQEVVARLHYRGTPKRRSFIARLQNAATPTSGAELYAETAGSSVGNLVNPISLDGNVLALAAATLNGAESGLHLDSLDGPLLELIDLPYPLSADAD